MTVQLPISRVINLSLAECRGAGRRLVFFIVCIALGVSAVMAIKSFSVLIERTLGDESRSLLAGDIEIKGSWSLSQADLNFVAGNLPTGSAFHSIKELKAMARYTPDNRDFEKPLSMLVELKAIPTNSPLYPMYGVLETRPAKLLTKLLTNQGALVEPAFLVRSGLKIGDFFNIGEARVKITGEILAEPDRISRSFSIGPRIMISLKTLNTAKLVNIGSKVNHRNLIRLPKTIDLNKIVAKLESGLSDKTAGIRTYKTMQSSLNNSIQQMSRYLACISLIALLMGGIGVAMIVRTFLAQKLNSIAILNCLGSTSKTIFAIYISQILTLGLIGSLLGVGLGYSAQAFLPALLEGLLEIHIQSEFYLVPALQALLLGLFTTLLFGVWPLMKAVKTPPLRLFRHIIEETYTIGKSREKHWLVVIFFSLSLIGILFWQAGSVKRGLVFFGALATSTCLLAGISKIVLNLLKKLPSSSSMMHRYGIANIHRPNNQAISIITALGMGIMLVLSVRLVQLDMIAMLENNAEISPPNYFFIDIQPDQQTKFIEVVGLFVPETGRTITPLVRSRFLAIDGHSVDNWDFHSPREEHWIRREFVLTYTKGPPPLENEIVKGKWWDLEGAKTAQVSLEEDAALRLNAKIGSIITMDVQGVEVSATVTSIRRVNWRNMRTNFYMIFTPSALTGAPASLVATVNVPPEKELEVQQAVVDALPNVTALSTKDIVDTLKSVISKLIKLVDFMSAFSILAGLFILSGAVASTKYRRLRESAILKTLGAKKSRVVFILGTEYAGYGIIAAFVGTGLSIALSWTVMRYLVQAPWSLYPKHLAGAFIIASTLTILAGLISSNDVIRKKPLLTLRQSVD